MSIPAVEAVAVMTYLGSRFPGSTSSNRSTAPRCSPGRRASSPPSR
ncbi:hypothetical protein ACFQ0M_12165 [Kitasatospora aburaviensis]